MLTGRRSLALFVLAPALVLGAPAGAQAACGVASAKADYETPEVQVYTRATKHKRVRDLVACHRATGKARVVGVRANDGMGTDESSFVNAVLGGRWVWTSMLASAAESSDAREDTLADLRTGQKITVMVEDEFTDAETLAVPGALLVAGQKGLTARFTDGHTETLSAEPAGLLAASGPRVYWRVGATAHTAVLTLPAADPPAKRPLARTTGRCKPKRNARLLVRSSTVVVSRAGGEAWACRPSRGTTQRLGAVEAVSLVSDRDVAYSRPGVSGVFDVVRGTRRELDSTSAAVNGATLVAAGPAGVRSWAVGKATATLLAAEPATEVAVSDEDAGTVAYWLDGAALPRAAAVAG